jgi:hypothetical protein
MISAASQDVNCRYGPGVGWLTVGALKAGQSVPVYGSDQYRTWWEIDSSWNTGEHCWVSGQVTTLSGDYLSLPVLGPPEALVIAVQVKTTAVVHGTCGGPNPTDFTGVITTNGPATVIYHWEIYNTGSNSLLNTTSNISLVIAAAGIQSFSSSAFTADCGTYLTKLVVTSPGSMTGQANWSVVHP